MNDWTRRLAIPAVLLGLASSLPAPARAQAPNEPVVAGEESEGDPVYGYFATTALCCAALFAVGKSARR